MAYNTKAIKTDVNGKPVPQYFNQGIDDYEALFGANGAMRTLLYDANGSPLLTEPNPGYVRAGDGMIAALGALADAAVTNPAITASVIALLKGLLTKLADPATETTLVNLLSALTAIRDTDGIKKITDAVDIADRAARALGVVTAADGGLATLGAKADAAVTDPALSASGVALLKGLLKQLQGGGTGAAPVSLNGSDVLATKRTVTTTPLAAGASFTEASWQDLSIVKGAKAIALAVDADTLTSVRYGYKVGTQESSRGILEITGNLIWIPPFRPYGELWRWSIFNPTSLSQTRLKVTEYLFWDLISAPQNIRVNLIYNLAIRDTNLHTTATDPGYIFPVYRILLGGGKIPIYIRSTFDQEATVTIQMNVYGWGGWVLGTKSVPAGASVLVTNFDFPGIDVPSEGFELKVQCTTAPTTGTMIAMTDTLAGGSA